MILSTGLASKSVIIILTLWLAVASAWTNAASKVVLLYDERIDLPGLAILDASLRATLVADRNHRIEIFREEMNLSRFGSESYLIHLREHLREKYRDIEVDVVVPVMGPALDFVLEHGESVFPDSAIVFSGIGQRELAGKILAPNVTGVLVKREFRPTFDLALKFHPGTKNIVVVAGTSGFDSQLLEQARGEFRSYESHLKFTYLTTLPFDETLERLTRLPARSLVLYITLFRDGAGQAFIPHQALEGVVGASSAPVYGFVDQYLGHGIVGGYLYSLERHGKEAARLVLRVLEGETISQIPVVETAAAKFMFDQRQLRRWSIDERRLPRGSNIHFREATLWTDLWTKHRDVVLGAFFILVLQGLLIGHLLVQRSRMRKIKAGLKESEEKYRQLIESQSDLICRYLPDTTLTFVNEAYCRCFNKTREELIGRKFLDLLPEHSHKDALQHIALVAEKGMQLCSEHHVLLPEGGIGWHHWVDYPIYGKDGEIAEFQAIGRDISDRKKAEEAQQHLSHALRLAVAGELTAMVAHEISQPIAAIMANAYAAQILLDSDDPPLDEIRQIFVDIGESNSRADQAIRRIRALLRRREMHLQTVDINETVSATLRLINGDALLRKIQIRQEFYPDLPLARGDQVYLQQVLLNLLVNGMDSMNDSPVSTRLLTVKTLLWDKQNISVVVSDRGNGIALESAGKIFNSFYSTKHDGMGLGLAISRSIIETHKGRIWAENNTGGGATFQFTLRIA